MPRAKQTMDGNTAAAHVAYAYTDVAAIYPITPSSPMADSVDQWSAAGQKNIFGNQVKVVEMESEAGAAGAVHGSLGAGAVTTTFTASQGLLLMIPNMYKIAAEQLPCVFDVSARTVATQSLNIFGDHSDVMACRQTGFAMLVESSVQEVMDLSPVAHLCAIEGKVPFLNFFDGFRTSHEYQKIEKWDYADLKEMCNMEAVEEFRKKALNPEHPKMRGSHENGDVFFQHREACNSVYNALPAVVEKYMAKINAKLGTNYDLFNYYGAPDADRVIVAMGSICDVADEVIDYLNAKGEKVGIVKVRLYRPWVSASLLKVLPKTAKKVAVLDRTKEPGSLGEPLYLDVAATLREAGLNDIVLTGGRYGLGSKDTPPSSIFALYKELEKDQPKERFTLGITDDVTFLYGNVGFPFFFCVKRVNADTTGNIFSRGLGNLCQNIIRESFIYICICNFHDLNIRTSCFCTFLNSLCHCLCVACRRPVNNSYLAHLKNLLFLNFILYAHLRCTEMLHTNNLQNRIPRTDLRRSKLSALIIAVKNPASLLHIIINLPVTTHLAATASELPEALHVFNGITQEKSDLMRKLRLMKKSLLQTGDHLIQRTTSCNLPISS